MVSQARPCHETHVGALEARERYPNRAAFSVGSISVLGDVWIFGYGSLVWRPDFDSVESRPAFIVHWARRFWQGSTDHRGVPGSPGRVVTLVHSPDAVTWGIAYRVAADRAEPVLSALDHREKGGYARESLAVHFRSGEQVSALTYRATPDNPNYLGPASEEAIAVQAARCRGPSGSNVDYVLRLAAALEALGAEDSHVAEVAELVRPTTR
jgi:cation transport regulator ChaC